MHKVDVHSTLSLNQAREEWGARHPDFVCTVLDLGHNYLEFLPVVKSSWDNVQGPFGLWSSWEIAGFAVRCSLLAIFFHEWSLIWFEKLILVEEIYEAIHGCDGYKAKSVELENNLVAIVNFFDW
ncbi:hypothetical protein COLO4_12041 [Corchorus olitorius]|uniref:Uncharacterized protein n=1 Tax=Corchorus olitorius TaxID=93759 RepID=A0A1R3K2E4_9ROSI|nr:hypothetical protein COLO4_12041 [Corchorus olitorius]